MTGTVVDIRRERARPPDCLTPDEANLFRDIVNHCRPDHFQPQDVPLLAMYVTAIFTSRRLAATMGTDARIISVWEKVSRSAANMATKLRLTPSGRMHPRHVTKPQKPVSAYDLMGGD